MPGTEHVDLTHYGFGGFVVTVNDARGATPVWWGAGFDEAMGWAERFRTALGIAQPVHDLVTAAPTWRNGGRVSHG